MELDRRKKYLVLGSDEQIWFFVYQNDEWNAYSGLKLYESQGLWSESSVVRFLHKHQHLLTDSDRIDLYVYLHKGGWQKQINGRTQKHLSKTLPNP